jgi:hypothetical protein
MATYPEGPGDQIRVVSQVRGAEVRIDHAHQLMLANVMLCRTNTCCDLGRSAEAFRAGPVSCRSLLWPTDWLLCLLWLGVCLCNIACLRANAGLIASDLIPIGEHSQPDSCCRPAGRYSPCMWTALSPADVEFPLSGARSVRCEYDRLERGSTPSGALRPDAEATTCDPPSREGPLSRLRTLKIRGGIRARVGSDWQPADRLAARHRVSRCLRGALGGDLPAHRVWAATA